MDTPALMRKTQIWGWFITTTGASPSGMRHLMLVLALSWILKCIFCSPTYTYCSHFILLDKMAVLSPAKLTKEFILFSLTAGKDLCSVGSDIASYHFVFYNTKMLQCLYYFYPALLLSCVTVICQDALEWIEPIYILISYEFSVFYSGNVSLVYLYPHEKSLASVFPIASIPSPEQK